MQRSPTWVEGLQWWFKWAFIGGFGALTAFLPTVLSERWQVLGIGAGAALILFAFLGSSWHVINLVRERHGKDRLTLDPNYLIFFGLAIAIIGAIWNAYRDTSQKMTSKEIHNITAPLTAQIEQLKRELNSERGSNSPLQQASIQEQEYTEADVRRLLDALTDAQELVDKTIAPSYFRVENLMANPQFHNGVKKYLQTLIDLRDKIRSEVWPRLTTLFTRHMRPTKMKCTTRSR